MVPSSIVLDIRKLVCHLRKSRPNHRRPASSSRLRISPEQDSDSVSASDLDPSVPRKMQLYQSIRKHWKKKAIAHQRRSERSDPSHKVHRFQRSSLRRRPQVPMSPPHTKTPLTTIGSHLRSFGSQFPAMHDVLDDQKFTLALTVLEAQDLLLPTFSVFTRPLDTFTHVPSSSHADSQFTRVDSTRPFVQQVPSGS